MTVQLVRDGDNSGLYEILDSCEFKFDDEKLKKAFKDSQTEEDPDIFLENLGICRIIVDYNVYIND